MTACVEQEAARKGGTVVAARTSMLCSPWRQPINWITAKFTVAWLAPYRST